MPPYSIQTHRTVKQTIAALALYQSTSLSWHILQSAN